MQLGLRLNACIKLCYLAELVLLQEGAIPSDKDEPTTHSKLCQRCQKKIRTDYRVKGI